MKVIHKDHIRNSKKF